VGSPVRFAPKAHISPQSVAAIPTARADSSAISLVSSSASPAIGTSDKDKEIVTKSLALDLCSGGKTVDNSLPTASAESTAACFGRTYADVRSCQK
jgi:hypothetical protein